MKKEVTIRFTVVGTCEQTIELDDDCKLSPAEIVQALNGESELSLATTTHEDGELIIVDDLTKIGKIVSSDMDSEYTEFSLEGTS